MRRIVLLMLAGSALAPGGTVAADAGSEGSRAKEISWDVAGVLGTVIYTPLKGLLCVIGGGFGGAAAYVSSGPRAMQTVANASCTGTWIITPEILKGEKSLEVVREQPCCGYPASP